MRTPSRPRLIRLIAALAFTMMVAAPFAQAPLSAQNGQGRVNVLIAFRNTPGPSEQAIVRGAGGNIKFSYTIVPAIAADLPAQAVAALQRNPAISTIEPDAEVTALGTFDSELTATWGVKAVGGGTAADAGAGVKVAVIDTGIDCNHPELKRNGVTICDGGWDFINNDSDPYDDNGHGTHVSGTIAAAKDTNGVVGVAPGVRLYALKVLGSNGSGSFSAVIAALQWAVDHGIQVTNNSYGSSTNPGSTVEAAFVNAYNHGVLSIAAAGNTGSCTPTTETIGYPANYASVVAVAATDSTNTRACFSSTGAGVELSAPGVSITSSVPGTGYGTWNGTSMATPHVVGVAALVIGNGVTGPAAVRARLQSTATDLGPAGRDPYYGFGLVNAKTALSGGPNTTPTVLVTSPASGASFTTGKSVTFTGTATDTQDGSLSSSLKWTSNLQGTIGTGASVSTSSLSIGTHAITASATDSGSLTGSNSIQVTITALPTPPSVTISSPGNASSFVSGTSVTFTGTATDTQDGNLASALSWNSSLQGAIGSGASFSTSTLSVGTHTITASATDSSTLTGTASIQVTITAPALSPVNVAHVSAIGYSTSGGKNGKKDLNISITVVNQSDAAVANATVTLLVTGPTTTYTVSATTGTSGMGVAKISNAPTGTYTSTVKSLSANGYTANLSTPSTTTFTKK
jgi:subtilisin family serine protease